MFGLTDTLYPDTFYINDYKFTSYTPLPEELLGEVPEQIDSLDERVTELEENGVGGGNATLPEGAMVVKKKEFTGTTGMFDWLNENHKKVIKLICETPSGTAELTVSKGEGTNSNTNNEPQPMFVLNYQYMTSTEGVVYIIGQNLNIYSGFVEIYMNIRLYMHGEGVYSINADDPQYVPHEYTSELGTTFTIYYVD